LGNRVHSSVQLGLAIFRSAIATRLGCAVSIRLQSHFLGYFCESTTSVTEAYGAVTEDQVQSVSRINSSAARLQLGCSGRKGSHAASRMTHLSNITREAPVRPLGNFKIRREILSSVDSSPIRDHQMFRPPQTTSLGAEKRAFPFRQRLRAPGPVHSSSLVYDYEARSKP
jgi:hypothetical protein